MVSTAGGENGEACAVCAVGTAAWGICVGGTIAAGICAGGTTVAGTAVFGLGLVAGTAVAGALPSGLCLAGTCMGIESMPIWTDGPDAGDPATGMRGLVEGVPAGAAYGRAAVGGGVMFTSSIGPEPGLGGMTDVGMTVGPMAAKASGGGTAVFATLIGAGITSGGGVGG